MNSSRFLVVAALAAALSGQEVRREVVPGREFRDSKVLTPGQVDIWEIDAVADEVLRCRVTASDLDPVLELVDADGVVLRHQDGKGSQSYVQFRTDEARQLRFRVRGFQGAGGGRYELTLERYVAPELTIGAECGGKFGPERWHHVRVHLDRGECFVPVVDGGRLTQVQLQERSLMPQLGVYRAKQAGEYHLRIEGKCDGHYRLRTLRPTRRKGQMDQPIQACVEPFGLDIVRVRLAADTATVLDLGMPNVQLQQWRRLLGKEPHCRELSHANKGGRVRRLLWSKPGVELELWLRNETGQAADYCFAVRTAEQPLAAPGTHSGHLPLGKLVCHTMRFQAGEIVSLAMASDHFDPYLMVSGPNGNPVGNNDDRGPLDRTAGLTFHAQHTGTYRITGLGYHGSGAYDLQVVRHELPQLSFDRALQLACAPGANAHANLRLAAGQEVGLSVRSAGVDVALTLVDDLGRRYGPWEGGGIGGDVLQAFRAERACSLTLFVHARSGKGTCMLRAFAIE